MDAWHYTTHATFRPRPSPTSPPLLTPTPCVPYLLPGVRAWRNGRREGLKHPYRKVCRFESDRPHQ